MTELPRSDAVRVERARSDFVKGVVRPDAPGMVYYPSLPELAETYDLVLAVLERNCKDDDWLAARKEAMTYSAITPFSAAVDASPEVVSRAVVVAEAIEELDDITFKLAKRGMEIATLAMERLEEDAEDDPVKAIRALRSVSQTMESLHRTAKQAYDPTSVRPENTVNINVNTVQASEDVVQKVAAIYAKMEQDAIARGIDLTVIEGEIIEDEGDNDE